MSTKLYIGNLPRVVEEHQLHALFGADGRKVLAIQIIRDAKTRRCRGFGFVKMETPRDARLAIEALNGKEFLGRPLSVTLAREDQTDQKPKTPKSRVWNRTFD